MKDARKISEDKRSQVVELWLAMKKAGQDHEAFFREELQAYQDERSQREYDLGAVTNAATPYSNADGTFNFLKAVEDM